jgi:hypothetical protein
MLSHAYSFDCQRSLVLFTEVAMISYHKGMHKVSNNTNELILKFKIQATGLNLSDAVALLQDS